MFQLVEGSSLVVVDFIALAEDGVGEGGALLLGVVVSTPSIERGDEPRKDLSTCESVAGCVSACSPPRL